MIVLIISPTAGAVAGAATIDHDYRGLYVFGDSLSDPGNVYALTGTSTLPPYTQIPTAPYVVGGFHFTNGKTWAERFAARLGLPNGGKPAFASPGIYGNYAIGTSRAASSGSPLLTFGGQVGTFLSNVEGEAPADALYVVWFAANDIRDALLASLSDPTLATSRAIIDTAVDAEAEGIARLHAAGARKFLVLNAPNVALAPIVTVLGPQAVAGTLLFTDLFNTGLDAALDDLESELTDVKIIRFDVFALLSDIAADPRASGFRNTTDPCVRVGVTTAAYCAGRNGYLFWDSIHPTAAAHRLLARSVARAFAEIE